MTIIRESSDWGFLDSAILGFLFVRISSTFQAKFQPVPASKGAYILHIVVQLVSYCEHYA